MGDAIWTVSHFLHITDAIKLSNGSIEKVWMQIIVPLETAITSSLTYWLHRIYLGWHAIKQR